MRRHVTYAQRREWSNRSKKALSLILPVVTNALTIELFAGLALLEHFIEEIAQDFSHQGIGVG